MPLRGAAPAVTTKMLPLAVFMLVDAPNPLGQLGPYLQLGLAGVFLWIWIQERAERRERQMTDDKRYQDSQDANEKRYQELLIKLIEALKSQK
jgi:hypothetical protein